MKAGPELHKNGRGTFRSIRTALLLIFEVEMEESRVPLLHRKKKHATMTQSRQTTDTRSKFCKSLKETYRAGAKYQLFENLFFCRK